MKTIGMIGGMSWESTVTYYQLINTAVRQALGGLHSAKLLLYSVDFAQLEQLQSAGDWDACAALFTEAALRLVQAGADFILLCSNTPHIIAPKLQERIPVPLLHIAEVAAKALQAGHIDSVALLGTRFTMHASFYRDTLTQAGIRVLLPDEPDVEKIDRIIFNELCLGVISPESKEYLLSVIKRLASCGANGVLLACTELGMLVKQEDTPLPLFDTTLLHAAKAASLALA